MINNKKCVLLLVVIMFGLVLFPTRPVQAAKMDRPITAWPLVLYRGDSDSAYADVLWPVFRYDRKGEWKRFAVRPLIFATKSDTAKDYRQTNIFWPLIEYERSGTKDLSLHVFPLLWYRNSLYKKYSIVFPVYWKGESGNSSYLHIWPLFGVSKKAEFTERSFVYPFFRYKTNADSSETDLNLFWPLFNLYTAKNYNSLRFFPLFYLKNDQVNNQFHLNLLLILSDYKNDNNDRSFFLFPFYWWADRSRGSYLHVWPLFGISRDGSSVEYSTIYPFFRYKTDPENRSKDLNLIWPLINYQKSPDRNSFRFLPLVYFDHDQYSKTEVIFPLYYNKQSGSNRLMLITPLYIDNRSADQSFKMLIPLYADYRQKDLSLRTIIPFYFHINNSPFSFTTIFPVYYHSADTKKDNAFTYYFPFYGSYKRGDYLSRHFLLFPLYANIKDNKLGIRGWDALWPLLHYETSPDSYSFRALPFYLHNKTGAYDFATVFPLYWYYQAGEKEYMHILPLYSRIKKGDWYTKTFILGPLYIKTEDKQAKIKSLDIIYPIFSSRQGENESRSWLIPFYYHNADKYETFSIGSLALLPPYYIHKESNYEKYTHLWPFFGKSEEGTYKEYSIVWPLFRFGRDEKLDYTKTHLLLYYHDRSRKESFTVLFPAWWHSGSPNSISDRTLFLHSYERFQQAKSFRLLWFINPDFALVHVNSDPNNKTNNIFPLYSYKHYYINDKNNETSEFRILWRFVRNYQTSQSHVFEFNPFYYYERKEEEGSYWAILGGLFGLETSPEQHKKARILWIF